MELEVFHDEQIRDADLIDIDQLKEEAESIDDERLREENIDTLVNEIVDGELLTPPKVRTDQAERTVESEPPNAEVRVEMPVRGDIELLKHPSISLSSSEEPFTVEYEDGMLSYVVEVGDKTSGEVNREINSRQSMLEIKPDQSADNIEDKNDNAKRAVRGTIKRRREEIKSEEEKLDDILDPDDDDSLPHLG
jgi:uncharacterized FlaG/YvyC family protein